MSLPKYINSRSLTDLLNRQSPKQWTYTRVQNILKRMGIAHEIPGARGIWVAPEDLAGFWADAYEEILENLEDIEPYVHGHTKRKLNRAKKQSVSKQTRVKIDT